LKDNGVLNIRYYVKLIGFIIFLIPGYLLQGKVGQAGVESPFIFGAGARMLSMGNAAVAFPDDPSAFIWNPAGMVIVQERKVSLSLTTLFEGSQYNFIGYIHPTINSGTFGFGITRIGTGGIPRWEDRGIDVKLDDFSFWQGKLSLAYGLTLWRNLSAGLNFEANRQVFGDFSSSNGFSIDIGLLYGITQRYGIMNNVFFGCNFISAISRMKLGEEINSIPPIIRIGMAKVITFRKSSDRWIFLFDIENLDKRGNRTHFGIEYLWNRMVSLRCGLNNGEVTFGCGLRYHNFQLDYGIGRIGDADFFPKSHRFSLIFYIGKSIPEEKRFQEEQRQNEIQKNIKEQVEAARQRRIDEGLQTGKKHLLNGDYFNARLEFSRVLREDENNKEAQKLLTLTQQKDMLLQKQREKDLLQQEREKEKQVRDNAFVNQRLIEGNEALEKGDFQESIEKWQEALERDPNNPQINKYIKKAKDELKKEVNKLIASARQYIRQGNLSEAYKVLERAKDQTVGDLKLQNKVKTEIRRLDNTVDFQTNYQGGLQRYRKGEYDTAAKFFKKALEYDPDNERVRELYRISLARSIGKKTEMKGDVRTLFNEGVRLYREGRYEDALKVWDEALELDPHNVTILNAVQGAKNKLETYKKQD
jgi:tetratricopeptide (TPR) repeat protein